MILEVEIAKYNRLVKSGSVNNSFDQQFLSPELLITFCCLLYTV